MLEELLYKKKGVMYCLIWNVKVGIGKIVWLISVEVECRINFCEYIFLLIKYYLWKRCVWYEYLKIWII